LTEGASGERGAGRLHAVAWRHMTTGPAQEVESNDISSELRFAALHDCETKWKTCGKPNGAKSHDIDSFGIPTDGS